MIQSTLVLNKCQLRIILYHYFVTITMVHMHFAGFSLLIYHGLSASFSLMNVITTLYFLFYTL